MKEGKEMKKQMRKERMRNHFISLCHAKMQSDKGFVSHGIVFFFVNRTTDLVQPRENMINMSIIT